MRDNKLKNNKAVGYVRVSGWAQADHGISLEHQSDMVRRYCESNGLELVELIIEAGKSAYKQTLTSRQDGKRIVGLTDSGECCHVVTLRLDRLFRSQLDCLTTVVGWDQLGVALHLIDLGGSTVDTSTPLGRVVISVLAAMGEMESHVKSERMREAWAHMKGKGKILGSIPPFGYSVGNDGTLYPNQDEQDTITLISQLREAGCSYGLIVSQLEYKKRKPRGKQWNPTTVVRILKRLAV